ncbi:MAG: cell division protein ZapD [Pseudomonadota bacterium]
MAAAHACVGCHLSNNIVFEHPLNERTRLLLRLAHLFEQLEFFLPLEDSWQSRTAMASLLDIASILSRSDIKSEIIKELERQLKKLGAMSKTPGIDQQRLGQILDDLERHHDLLRKTGGQLGQGIRENEFLKNIMQRSTIPGGNCAFDLPQYHYWLKLPADRRVRQMQQWTDRLRPLEQAVSLVVSLIRSSSRPRPETAAQGFFQLTLDSKMPIQLVRVTLPKELGLFAEISGGKHRVSVRFLRFSEEGQRPSQVGGDVNFMLTTCVF